MNGKRQSDAYYLAGLLREGYKAKIVGDKHLLGVSRPLMWVDDQLVEVKNRQLEQSGVLLSRDKTILFATVDVASARGLLAEAKKISDEQPNARSQDSRR